MHERGETWYRSGKVPWHLNKVAEIGDLQLQERAEIGLALQKICSPTYVGSGLEFAPETALWTGPRVARTLTRELANCASKSKR
jgi:hypothetical protein